MIIKKITLFDNLRSVALISVIFIHLSGWFIIRNAKPYYFFDLMANISRFAVPMFVFISASLFFLKYSNFKINKRNYYSKKVKKIFFPYVFASFIYYIYKLSSLVSPEQKIVFRGVNNIKEFFFNLFTIGNFSHLYFIPLILTFYFIAPFLMELYKKNKLITIISMFIINITFILIMKNLGVDRLYWRWAVLSYLIYIILGFLFAEYYQKIKKIKNENLLAALAGVAALIIAIYQPYNAHLFSLYGFSSYIYDSLFGIFWVIVFLIVRFPKRVNALIKRISINSYGIYLYHYLVIDLIFSLTLKKHIRLPLNMVTFLFLLVFITIFSAIIYRSTEYLFKYKK